MALAARPSRPVFAAALFGALLTTGDAGPAARPLASLQPPAPSPPPAAVEPETDDPPRAPRPDTAIGASAAAQSPRNASYSIDVTLDHAARTLTGRQVLAWRNISPLTTSELRFHLYYNAWRNTRSTWMRERILGLNLALHDRPEADWGWIDVTRIRLLAAGDSLPIDLTADAAFVAPDDGNTDDRTVMAVRLPAPVAPGETIHVEVEWTSRVPRPFARTGAVGDYYLIAHWFPKIGVLEAGGWNCHQFHAVTEFYADYGIYDVRLTAPAGWVLGATGQQRRVADNGDGTATHHYTAEDVHDFAWTTSPAFVDLADRFEHPDLPDVDIRLLLQPEHRAQAERHFEATRRALKHYGEWFGPYPYDHLTVVDPPWRSGTGGMEYPTFFTAGTRWLAPALTDGPESVTVHEAGHQFFQGVVGTNEFEHEWLDEGLNTFATARALDQFFPHYLEGRFFRGFVPWTFTDVPWSRAIDGNRLDSYRPSARMDVPATPSYRYWPPSAFSISYDKTALWLHTLERHLGWPTLQRGLSAYYERWKFDHPQPQDLFDALSEAAGADLGWFFDQVHGSSAVFDYGVAQLRTRRTAERGFFDGEFRSGSDGDGDGEIESTVVVRRYADGIFPVDVAVEFADGHVERRTWDGRAQWTAYRFAREARATSAAVDPDRVLLLDVNYTNNSRTTEPRAGEAATKWALAWMVWLQDLLLTYTFLV